MLTKKCCMCKLELPVENFSQKKKTKDGLQGQCKECHKKYRHSHYLNNKRKYIDKAKDYNETFMLWWRTFKSTLKCNRCSENHPACLEFHHINRKEKEYNITKLVGNNSKTKLLKEMEKCEVLCSNCHSKEHWAEQYAGIVK